MPQTPTALLVSVGALFVAAGLVAVLAPLSAERSDVTAARSRGRILALTGLGAAGVSAALTGSLYQGCTVRIGGSSSGGALITSDGGAALAAGADPVPRAAAGTVGGFAFPWGALVMLAIFGVILFAGAHRFRAPIGVAVPAACWLVVVAVLMYGSDKGDVLLPADAPAQIYFFGGLLLAVGFFVPAYQWQLTDRFSAKQATKQPVRR